MNRIARDCVSCIVLCATVFSIGRASAQVADSVAGSDAFLAGALTMILDRELGWPRDSYFLEVHDGIATITLREDSAVRRAELQSHSPTIEGLQGINIVVAKSPSELTKPSVRRQVYSFLGLTPETTPFPTGDLFLPLLADPKQPQFFVSVRNYDAPDEAVTTAAVGYGETFGFYRREGKRAGDGLQVSISGGLFAQFNLDAPSNDLVNADYVIGFPVTYRHGPWSARMRIYHQSSHLGDEFLLRARPERINLSFESLEGLLSYGRWHWRGYLGGEFLVSHEPEDLKPAGAHGGLEYRGTEPILLGGRLVGGLDLKSWQEHNWSVDKSLKVGLEFGAAKPGRRRLRVMGEGYNGFAPHGQFYDDRIAYYGIGVYLGF